MSEPKSTNQENVTKLIEENHYLNEIMAHMPGNVYWKDKNGFFLGCNNNVLKLARLNSKQDIIGKTDYELIWKKQAEIISKNDKKIINSGKEKTIEETHVEPNGKRIIFMTRKVPLKDKNGQVTGILGISIDITDRKRAEQAEAKAEGMKLLAAAVAHEMRTPLATIDLCTSSVEEFLSKLIQLLKNKKTINTDASVKEIQQELIALLDIKHAIRVSFDFINTALSNLGYTSLKPLQFSNCSIIECVNEVIKEYPYNPAEDKTLIHWYPSKNFIFSGLKPAFKRVLVNLLKNAIYYVKAANKGNIEIWLEPGKEVNKLFFKDTGTGIAEDIQPHIFEKFFTKTENGSGIGLAFCRYIMESFGGTINCRSKYGEFTEFTLTFPIAKSHTEEVKDKG